MTRALDAEAPIEIETGRAPRAAVIWLHGLGADGSDFAGIAPELGLPGDLAVRFVFPHAPCRPVTLNNGYVMRAWYDLGMGERGFTQNAAHIAESTAAVHALARRELARGIDARRLVFAGFSQGGVVALHAGLAWAESLGGILVLSAPVVDAETLVASARANRDTPIFIAHGQHDPMAPFAMGERTAAALRTDGRAVAWHAYPMEHTVSREEIHDMGRWLGTALRQA